MTLNKLFKQNEPPYHVTLQKLSSVIKKLTFIKNITQTFQYHDEPKFFQYAVNIDQTKNLTDGHKERMNAGGSSFFNKEEAFFKSLCEAIERFSCSLYKKEDLTYGSIKNLGAKALSPLEFEGIHKNIRNNKKSRLFFDENTTFGWTHGRHLQSGKSILLPAQTIYHSYKFEDNEGVIYVPISTGAAGGSCMAAALVRGIQEAVERDAFMIAYLLQKARHKLDLSSIEDEQLTLVLEKIKKYNLTLHTFDITSNLGIPTYLAIVEDPTGIGTPISLGMKTGFNKIETLIDAIEESFHTKGWLRSVKDDKSHEYKKIDPSMIHTIEARGIYWYKLDMRRHLDFWLKLPVEKIEIKRSDKIITHGERLKQLIKIFDKHRYQIYYKDTTLLDVRNIGLSVVKVVIPKLQPLHLDERYPCHGGARLGRSKKINKIPHPFL